MSRGHTWPNHSRHYMPLIHSPRPNLLASLGGNDCRNVENVVKQAFESVDGPTGIIRWVGNRKTHVWSTVKFWTRPNSKSSFRADVAGPPRSLGVISSPRESNEPVALSEIVSCGLFDTEIQLGIISLGTLYYMQCMSLRHASRIPPAHN
ncbi:hypothetical protein AG1IA_05737 [Rhizoctonia solani AG-1 IA]|uniref:Uncharacterized protein n=1 Tax=Thanatephorus cucumeris (strain AG1-IA) TaxID=983506 RepID=L8WQ19_THACA|nr:hypothetical protein AG1IA_05737 [Rhizoctonia solani AG-1 IA]